jgi:hypothetical protein
MTEERAGFEPSLWRQNLPCFCATALLPLCRSEAQLNPDEKGAILAAGSPPLWTAGDRAPKAAYSELSLIPRSLSLLWLLFFPVMPLKIPC